MLNSRHIRDIQGELSGGQLYGAEVQQREFWAMMLLETENGAVGTDQVGVGQEETEHVSLAGHHLQAVQKRSWQEGGGGALGKWEGSGSQGKKG